MSRCQYLTIAHYFIFDFVGSQACSMQFPDMSTLQTTAYPSKDNLLVHVPHNQLLPPLWNLVLDYIDFLSIALQEIVDTYFKIPNAKFNAIETEIGNRWMHAVSDEKHVHDVTRRFETANPMYWIGLRWQLDEYNSAEDRLNNIMNFAPSRVYANPRKFMLWNDSQIGQNSTCVHFALQHDYSTFDMHRREEQNAISLHANEIVEPNADDDEQDLDDSLDNNLDDTLDDKLEHETKYTVDSDSEQETSLQTKPKSVIFTTASLMSKIYSAACKMKIVYKFDPKTMSQLYGSGALDKDPSLNSLSTQDIADSVPLDFENAHLEPEKNSWRYRRNLFRTLAFQTLVSKLTPILTLAKKRNEIKIVQYTTLNDGGECESLERALDIRVFSTKSNQCLLRFYFTRVRDNCAGC